VLAAHGFEVRRFWNNDVLRDTAAVLAVIAERVRALSRSSGRGLG